MSTRKERVILDRDVQLLAAVAAQLKPDYVSRDPEWEGSPFAWIKTRPSRQVGKIGEQLIAGWCAAKGLDVTRSGSSESDRIIHGYRTEIKFSTLWKNGTYVFQQFRNQEYDLVICLGVSPFDAHCWVISKTLALQHVIGHTGQHGGQDAIDTAWLHIKPGAPQAWLAPLGGKLANAYKVLLQIGPGPVRAGPLT